MLKGPGVGVGVGSSVGFAKTYAWSVADGPGDCETDAVAPAGGGDDGPATIAGWFCRVHGVTPGPVPNVRACRVAYAVPKARKARAHTSPTWATRTGWETRRGGRRRPRANGSGIGGAGAVLPMPAIRGISAMVRSTTLVPIPIE